MSQTVTMTMAEYDELKKQAAMEYRRGYDAGLNTARSDFAEVNTHKNELLRTVETLEGLLARERAGRAALSAPEADHAD